MSKNILVKTNLVIFAVIILGFLISSLISYKSSSNLFMKDIEHVATLTSDSIYYRLKTVFTKHIHVSLTMANDSLLKSLLADEASRLNDAGYVRTLSEYLEEYREAYDYDSVFLVSTATDRYYNFNGINRILSPGNPENAWYYEFLASDSDYAVNIDNDEAARNNEITVFINCRITDADGSVLGIVGIGLRVDYLQELLSEYENEFGVSTYLVNNAGILEIAPDKTGYQQLNYFDSSGYAGLQEEILAKTTEQETLSYWLDEQKAKNYIVARYIPDLSWHLLIEHDTSRLDAELQRQLLSGMLIMFVLIATVLLIVSYVTQKYNRRIIEITALRERERQEAFRRATEHLYDNITEMNITDNCAAGQSPEQAFAGLDLPAGATYDDAVRLLCAQRIKAEHGEEVRAFLSRDNILREYLKGNVNLSHDFLMRLNGREYRWTRAVVHIYTSKEDGTIRIFTYFRNIDEEKRQQLNMEEQAQRDGLTDIYNKMATKRLIEQLLRAGAGALYAFFIIDIDNFKQINDGYGHAAGDAALVAFVDILKGCFRAQDVVGRIGGDEFVAFVQVPGREWVAEKARMLTAALNVAFCPDRAAGRLSASIGVAIAPADGQDFDTLYKNADAALYATKKRGKNGFTLYGQGD